MTWRKNKRILRASLVLTIALLIPLFLIPLAHAGTYVGYAASNCTSGCGTTNWQNNYGNGKTVQAPFAGTLVSIGIFTANAGPSNIIILTTASSVTGTSYGCTAGQTCGTITDNTFSFTVQDDEPVTLGANSFQTVNLANPVTVTNGQFIAIMFTGTASSCQNSTCVTILNNGASTAILDTCMNFATNTPGVGQSFNGRSTNLSGDANCNGTGAGIYGGSFNPTGSGSSGTSTVTQCYGNCGNPAVTLVNTNSTHSVNFNQSQTLFYQFQSNLNGFILNVTTSLAKSYTNGQILRFGVYQISSCPSGQTPFSAQCPGLLISAGSTQNLVKGKNTLTLNNLAVFNGQWTGIAISAVFSGLDLNDTNTSVVLLQTNEGSIPNVIQNPITSTTPASPSKMGLWAFIRGNVVNGVPPTSPSGGACGPGLDSLLTCVINSSCTLVTIQCQTGSSILWIIILTVITLMVTLGGFSYLLPNMTLSTRGMGEFAVLIFVGWFLVLASFSLLVPYAMILLFFIVSWLFIGRLRNSGPI